MTRTAGGSRGRTRTRAVVDPEVADLPDESAYPGSCGVSVNRCKSSSSTTSSRASILPETFEPLRRDLGVDHGTGNTRVPHVRLNRAGIDALVSQFEPTAMAEHVRVNRHAEPLSGPGEHLAHIGRRHRATTLRDEDVRGIGVLAFKTPQSADLAAGERVRTIAAIFQAIDVNEAFAQIDGIPTQGDQLADAQRMAVGNEDQCGIAVPMPSDLLRGLDQLLDLRLRQEFP